MSLKDSPIMLQYLDCLLKHGNFTKAAKDLYISQPYLTQAVKKVEQELQIEIIKRAAGRMQLTEAGKIYYQYLETLEAEAVSLQDKLAKYSQTDTTVFRIGILASLGSFLLPLFLPAYLRKNPQVKIFLEEDFAKYNEAKTAKGELDFYIGQNPETVLPNLTVYSGGSETYFAIIPQSSLFYEAGQKYLLSGTIPVKQLLCEPLILTKNGSSIRRQVDSLLQRYKIAPQIVLESSSVYTTAELAKSGLGTAIVTESIAAGLKKGAYNLYPLATDLISLNFFIAHAADKTLSSAAKSLIASFLQEVELQKH